MIFNMNYGGGSGSGGTGFNFTIVDGATRPSNPSQNMLWVCTEQECTGYAFSAVEPSAPNAGILWLCISNQGGTKVCVPVGSEWIVLRISFVKQYTGEEWVDCTSMIYSGCEWAQIIPTEEPAIMTLEYDFMEGEEPSMFMLTEELEEEVL
jgi:hypothetical protein